MVGARVLVHDGLSSKGPDGATTYVRSWPASRPDSGKLVPPVAWNEKEKTNIKHNKSYDSDKEELNSKRGISYLFFKNTKSFKSANPKK